MAEKQTQFLAMWSMVYYINSVGLMSEQFKSSKEAVLCVSWTIAIALNLINLLFIRPQLREELGSILEG